MKIDKESLEKKIKIKENLKIGQRDFFLIAGPCVIENEKMAFFIAERLKEITEKLSIPFIFKASYDKANRSSLKSFRGLGFKKGINILKKIKEKLNIAILTDVHETKDVKLVAKVIDVLQIPAFLCRQTDLILKTAETGKAINIKKGQFLSPYEIFNVIEKVESTGNKNIILTERGFSFGYNNLVVDMRSIFIMKNAGYPLVIDATHSVQRPGGAGDKSSGDREFVPVIAKSAIAAGANGVFLEVHHNIKNALSDRATQYPLDKVENLLEKLKEIFKIANE
ncbi:MAG: 3-deoxy-8-phosphooctulonate synthase [Candidatus Goldbacteria bacterium]|nr:3-deoxy-8-phosphooctulonate synthase [Candidatus Goldiibacteriota bacterium]